MRPRPIPFALRAAVVAFGLWHAAAITFTHLPPDSALSPLLTRPFGRYLIATGTWQKWDMFDSAPTFHAYDVELVATFPGGVERAFGPLLPGLGQLDRFVRNSSYFLRTIDGPYSFYGAPYAREACAAVRVAAGIAPETVRLRQRIGRTRSLVEVRRNGVIAERSVVEGKVTPCPP